MQSRWERALELLKKNRGGILSCAREGTPLSLVFHCHPSSWPISSRTPHPPVKGVLPVPNHAPNINLIPPSRSPLAYSRAYLCFRERVERGSFFVLPEVISRARSFGCDNTFGSPLCNPPSLVVSTGLMLSSLLRLSPPLLRHKVNNIETKMPDFLFCVPRALKNHCIC